MDNERPVTKDEAVMMAMIQMSLSFLEDGPTNGNVIVGLLGFKYSKSNALEKSEVNKIKKYLSAFSFR